MINNNYKLKIGLDYHGVINKDFSYFSKFCSEAISRGHQIFIITGGPQPKIRQQLQYNKVPYNFIFAISDYYQALGLSKQLPDGKIVVPDMLWNKAKGSFCRRNDIDFHIDDNIKYSSWFTTPFCLYQNKECYIGSKIKIKLTGQATEAISALEDIALNMSFVK